MFSNEMSFNKGIAYITNLFLPGKALRYSEYHIPARCELLGDEAERPGHSPENDERVAAGEDRDFGRGVSRYDRATGDVRREGVCEDYFPRQVPGTRIRPID